MLRLLVDKIRNYLVYGVTKKILVAEYSLDCLSDSSKPAGFPLVLGMEIPDEP